VSSAVSALKEEEHVRKPLNLLAAVGIAGTVVLTGHAPSSSAQPGQAALPVYRVENWISPSLKLARTLDPAQVSSVSDAAVIRRTNAGLVQIDTSGKVVGDLADKWTISKNRKVYKFHIRSNARFANGHKVKASDFVYSIKRALAPATGSLVAYYDLEGFGEIKGATDYNNGKTQNLPGVKAIGKSTVQITLAKPIAYFLKAFTYDINDALDPAVLTGKEAGRNNNYLTSNCPANVGAGPFRFKCTGNDFYPSGQTPRYTLVPNKYYWGPKPKFSYVMGVAGNSESAYNEYLAGKVESVGITGAHVAEWQKNPRGQMIGGPDCPKPTKGCPTTDIFYNSINATEAPFDNKSCRLAVAYGINRSALRKIQHNTVVPLYTIVTPHMLGYFRPQGIPTYNLAKAKAYAAKCPNKTAAIQFVYASGDTDATNDAEAQVAMIKSLGFTNATAKGLPQNNWLDAINTPMSKTHINLVTQGWVQDYPDPQDFISLLWKSDSAYNITGWGSKKFDQISGKADVEPNVKKRAALYKEAQTVALNAGIPIMLYTDVNFRLQKTYVKGLQYYINCGYCPAHRNWSKVTIKH